MEGDAEEGASAGDVLDYGYKETADSIDSNTELDTDDMPSLHKDLAAWATTSQTHVVLNKLLGILRKHGHTLPKDRTLLATLSGFEIKNNGGQYTYYGLELGILQYLSQNPSFTGSIDITINIDGLPIFKSSKTFLEYSCKAG